MPDTEILNIRDINRFRHDAMAATFEVFIIHSDGLYANQAANAAFAELDRIENDISRFIENSDVSRINSLGKGRPLLIGLQTFECLQIAVEMFKRTHGAFDITLRHKPLKLDEINHTVELKDDRVQIDLGGIGKGYAADKMSQVLKDWGVDAALISAGQSTVLPIGKPSDLSGWPVTISNPPDNHILAKIHLADTALSASGLNKKGHIINPCSGKCIKSKSAAWAMAMTAAAADTLSTAFMVMSDEKIRSFCEANPDTSAIVIPTGRKKDYLRLGNWQDAEFKR